MSIKKIHNINIMDLFRGYIITKVIYYVFFLQQKYNGSTTYLLTYVNFFTLTKYIFIHLVTQLNLLFYNLAFLNFIIF